VLALTLEGYNGKEIAEILGITRYSVRREQQKVRWQARNHFCLSIPITQVLTPTFSKVYEIILNQNGTPLIVAETLSISVRVAKRYVADLHYIIS